MWNPLMTHGFPVHCLWIGLDSMQHSCVLHSLAQKVVRPMFSTADAPLMTDVELSEDTPANFLVR